MLGGQSVGGSFYFFTFWCLGFQRRRGGEASGMWTLFPWRLYCPLARASRNLSRSLTALKKSPSWFLFAVCRKELNKSVDPPPPASPPVEEEGPLGPDNSQGALGSYPAEGAGGGAGLTGFIQSALNQVFGNSGWSSPSQNETGKQKYYQ